MIRSEMWNFLSLQFFKHQNSIKLATGLPSTEETLNTTVHNLYRLFPYILDSLLSSVQSEFGKKFVL